MSSESSSPDGKNYRIPGRLHPLTEIDMSHGIPAEQLAGVPVCGFVRNEVLHETVELDFSQAGAKGTLDFFRDWREESCRLLLPSTNGPTSPVQPRAAGLEIFSEAAVQLVIGATLWEVVVHQAPKFFAMLAGKLWNTATGNEEITPLEVSKQYEELSEQIVANSEWLGEKDDTFRAELREVKKQLAQLPDALAEKIIARLEKQGMSKATAGRGLRAVSQAAANKAGA